MITIMMERRLRDFPNFGTPFERTIFRDKSGCFKEVHNEEGIRKRHVITDGIEHMNFDEPTPIYFGSGDNGMQKFGILLGDGGVIVPSRLEDSGDEVKNQPVVWIHSRYGRTTGRDRWIIGGYTGLVEKDGFIKESPGLINIPVKVFTFIWKAGNGVEILFREKNLNPINGGDKFAIFIFMEV